MLCNDVPVIQMPENNSIKINHPIRDLQGDLKIEEQEEQYFITGHIPKKYVSDNSLIYVIMNGGVYEAFPCSCDGKYHDYSFGLYVEKTEDINDIKIAVKRDGKIHITENKIK